MARLERLTTSTMASDGRAVARRPSGQVVFVEGALPAETVTAEITGEKSSYASARTVEVLSASAERIAAPCPRLAEGCGGCQWQHVTSEGQRRLKASIIQEALSRIAGQTGIPVGTGVALDPWHWRTTIRAGVTDGRAAFRQGRSHSLVPIEGCLIAHPRLVELLEGRRYGAASSVVLRCGARTGERLAAPVPAGTAMDLPDDVGTDLFHEEAAGRLWRVSAPSFFQSRPDGADALARLVSDAAEDWRQTTGRQGKPATAVDAYSGVGLFAGVLAGSGWTVTALEGSAAAVTDAEHNLAGLPARVMRVDVGRWRPEPADLVVADPSRAGLGRPGVSVLAATGASRLVLISCDAASLGRDAGLLADEGFILTSVTPVDLFPQTWRVEVVSIFDRLPERGAQ